MINNEESKYKRILKNNNEFLQCWEWGDFQKSLGVEIFRINIYDKIAALILKKRLPLGFNYLYIPRGPFLNNIHEINILVDFFYKIKEVAVDNKTIFLKIEPQFINKNIENFLIKFGFLRSKTIQPRKTILINLEKSVEQLLKDMRHDKRYAIRSAPKRKIIIETSFNTQNYEIKKILFEEFYNLLYETAKRNRFKIYPKEYFKKLFNLNKECKVNIIIAKLNNQIISGAMILFYNERAFYLYAGSKRGYNKYNAPSIVLWTSILEAKKLGFKILDLWGIEDDNQKNWAGFTTFKKGFGGEEFVYPYAWDFIYNKKVYIIFKILKSIRYFLNNYLR